jgi:peroxiredoxin
LARGNNSRVVASRTSYVILPDGKIACAHTAADADSHIREALATVKAWKASEAR